jgi:cytochrome c biogenesis protein CcdA
MGGRIAGVLAAVVLGKTLVFDPVGSPTRFATKIVRRETYFIRRWTQIYADERR